MIRRPPAPAVLALAALLLAPLATRAEPDIVAGPGTMVRSGNHPGFGRVVFDLPPDATAHVVTEGQRVLVVFTGVGGVAAPETLPRNLRAIRTGANTATLDLVPGAQARPVRLGDRLVIDMLDARPAGPAPRTQAGRAKSAPAPAPAPPEPDRAAAAPAPVPLPASSPPAPVMAPPPSAPPVQEAQAPRAAPAPEHPEPPPKAPTPAPQIIPQAPPLLLKADLDVGAAAFARGTQGYVVLDRRLPSPALPPGMVWTQGTVSSTLQVPLAPGAALRLSRSPAGWTVEQAATLPAEPMIQAVTADTLEFGVARPGRVVAILDPVSGGTLVIGPSLGADKGVAEARRTPAYRLLPSWLGVVVEPLSDVVDLRAGGKGFLLTGGTAPALVAGNALSRRFDLPDEPSAALDNRMKAQLASAASAPPRARSRDRLAAAQTMIAMGLGVEAQALVNQVATDDPQAAADAQTGALAAIAAILAGRPAEAAALDDPRLSGTDEIQLWRGLRDRRTGSDTEAARLLARTAPLALAYPPTLQRLVWPDIAEAAVESGGTVPADRLPPFAAALLLDRSGRVDEALAAYDAVAAGPDRLDQVRATVKAAELRLAAGRLTPAEASSILERQAYAWRGDVREARLRLRAAELQAAGQDWRPALDALRAIETTFPDQKPAVERQKGAVMEALLAAKGAGLSPLDLVLLAADYADCIPDGPAGTAMARLLADKLTALDLPARVIPVLQGLVRSTQPGEGRAELGARLAELLLEGKDAAAAITTLEASDAQSLPPALRERRGLLAARARAAQGDLASAMISLTALGTEGSDELRATLAEQAGDWRASLAALGDLAARRVPPEGPLPAEVQTLLVREANAAVRANDQSALATLRPLAARLDSPRADVFRLLTASPLGTPADLSRAKTELTAARGLPQRLQAAGLR